MVGWVGCCRETGGCRACESNLLYLSMYWSLDLAALVGLAHVEAERRPPNSPEVRSARPYSTIFDASVRLGSFTIHTAEPSQSKPHKQKSAKLS